MRRHSITTIRERTDARLGLYRCSCGSEFADEEDAEGHALNANAEDAAKATRQRPKAPDA